MPRCRGPTSFHHEVIRSASEQGPFKSSDESQRLFLIEGQPQGEGAIHSLRTVSPAAAELRREGEGEKTPNTQVFVVCPCLEAARCFSISENG